MTTTALSSKEQKRRLSLAQILGHSFDDLSLLKQALTHKSAIKDFQILESYQRLEFLGDRVLALIVTDMLIHAFPNADEGELARRLTALVRNETCFEIAQALKLGAYIYLGGGEAESGGRHKKTILGDVCESVIAAIYLDGGIGAARVFVEQHWRPKLLNAQSNRRDAKSRLQEWAQSAGLDVPIYSVIRRDGPDHAPEFIMNVTIAGLKPAQGVGSSKRIATQKAAQAMLKQIETTNPTKPDAANS